jgi:hypothetical protein
MKRFLPFIFILILACATEEKIGPSKASTFVRYFNGGSSDEAQAVIQTKDNGFLILANTAVKASEQIGAHYKVKIIKTDEFGNQVWQKFYPAFSERNENNEIVVSNDFFNGEYISRKGHGIIPVDDGYVIVGEDIQNGGTLAQLMVMTIDSNGDNSVVLVNKTPLTSVTGVGVAVNSKGNYLALGSEYVAPGSDAKSPTMHIAEFGKVSKKVEWSAQYGAGTVVNLANRLFLDAADNAFWGGTVKKDDSNTSQIRFIEIITGPSNPGGINFDRSISQTSDTEVGNDFCKYGAGFAVIGKTNKNTSGDFDIVFKRITANGTELSSMSFPLGNEEGDFKQNEEGNSICATRDGGLLLLGTVESNSSFGRGDKDYYLIKIDAFGTTSWTQVYGSKFEDIGVNVIQSSDGGYVVLGNTALGRVKTIMLMKTDKNGHIE